MTEELVPLIWLVSGFAMAMLAVYLGVRVGRGPQPRVAKSLPPPSFKPLGEEASIEELNKRARQITERLKAQESLPPTEM